MKTYIVYAERTTLEKTEVEANSAEEAQKIAFESENAYWESDEDIDWQITNAVEEDSEDYDEFGVNTKNSFNTEKA
jgi:hypothetical protein